MNRRLLGMLCVAAGVSVFSLQDAIIKGLSGSYPVHQLLVIRSIAALPMLFWILRIEGAGGLRLGRIRLHLVRGLLLYVAFMSYYLALARLSIAEVVAITFMAPFFVAALSVPMAGERVGLRSWLAIAAGFIGVLIVIRPGSGSFDPALLLPVGSALAYAIAALVTRRLGTSESGGALALAATIVYIAAGIATALALSQVVVPADAHVSLRFLAGQWATPSAVDLALLVACGSIAAVGFFLLGQGYRLSEANLAAPFEYVALPWGVLWGYVFFNNLPDAMTIVGAVVIVGAGLSTLRQARLAIP